LFYCASWEQLKKMTNKERIEKIDIEISWLGRCIDIRRQEGRPAYHEIAQAQLLGQYRQIIEYDLLKSSPNRGEQTTINKTFHRLFAVANRNLKRISTGGGGVMGG
jgi:hypothetical protein